MNLKDLFNPNRFVFSIWRQAIIISSSTLLPLDFRFRSCFLHIHKTYLWDFPDQPMICFLLLLKPWFWCFSLFLCFLRIFWHLFFWFVGISPFPEQSFLCSRNQSYPAMLTITHRSLCPDLLALQIDSPSLLLHQIHPYPHHQLTAILTATA